MTPDHLSVEGRSRVMAAIRSRDTKAEIALRRALRRAGATGYRVDVGALPGRPDIAFTRWRIAVFVDGVYWHGHPDHFRPESASPYWAEKIRRTQERDARANETLRAEGWVVLRYWDLDVLASPESVADQVLDRLERRGWHKAERGASRC